MLVTCLPENSSKVLIPRVVWWASSVARDPDSVGT